MHLGYSTASAPEALRSCTPRLSSAPVARIPRSRGRPACPLAPSSPSIVAGPSFCGRCRASASPQRTPISGGQNLSTLALLPPGLHFGAPRSALGTSYPSPREDTAAAGVYVRLRSCPLTSRWRWSQARTGLRTPRSNGRSRGPNADFWPMSRSPYIRTLKAGTSFEEGATHGIVGRRAFDVSARG